MIIVYPTETCYGVGCSAFDEGSIRKIYELKKRDFGKPLIVLVDSIKMWKRIAHVSKEAEILAKKYWPGPLTIILSKKQLIPEILAFKEVGVRWSSHKAPNELIKEMGEPIVSTSANISGKANPYSIRDIPDKILKAADRIIDGGDLDFNSPSTVVRLEKGRIVVVRKGSIKDVTYDL